MNFQPIQSNLKNKRQQQEHYATLRYQEQKIQPDDTDFVIRGISVTTTLAHHLS